MNIQINKQKKGTETTIAAVSGKAMLSLAILFFAVLFAVSCSDSSTGPENNSGLLAIRAINTGSVDFEVSYGMSTSKNEDGFTYCYSNEGCKPTSGGGAYTIFEGQPSVVDYSYPEQGAAVGIKVSLFVESGTGHFEVVRGKLDGEGVLAEFIVTDVVFTSDTYNKGDLVEFSWGKTE